ncbi:MAG: ribonuclease Y [Limisphaerales bacterium]
MYFAQYSGWVGGALLVGGGLLTAYGVLSLARLHRRREAADQAVDDARRQADTITREARLLANEEVLKLREQTEQMLARRRLEMDEIEKRLAERERLVNTQLERFVTEEQQLRGRTEAQRQREATLERQVAESATFQARQREELGRIARLSESAAREQLLQAVREESQKDAAELSRRILDESRLRAEERARRVLAIALQRFAGDCTFETTTATVALPNDEMKGRIIGREGRNIRSFEQATGVTVLIDDTPNAVVLSGFDPVRREVAREAMTRLIADGRIHPTRIEEIVQKVSEEMDDTVRRLGEQAVARMDLPPLHPDTTRLLGRLRFRHSFSQNILDHSIEVGHLCGLLAAEIGVNPAAARRAGLLHDIGKAVSHEMEGPHAIVGAGLLRQCGESPEIVNAVASHHDEVEPEGPLGILVSAADAMSASRPGARSETLTTYIKRVESLERLGASFPGVEKCFAVQAGRELRVFVRPDAVNDEQGYLLARSICRKIEDELQYPGQIRVTLVRETRCVEFAK